MNGEIEVDESEGREGVICDSSLQQKRFASRGLVEQYPSFKSKRSISDEIIQKAIQAVKNPITRHISRQICSSSVSITYQSL